MKIKTKKTDNKLIHLCPNCNVSEGKYHKINCSKDSCVKCRKKRQYCICKRAKREPFIYKPTCLCLRCGKLHFKMFMVNNSEWKRVVGATYDFKKVLCENCYDEIRKFRKIKKGFRWYPLHGA